MQQYKVTLRHRLILLILGAALCIAILAAGTARGTMVPQNDGTHFSNFLGGFQVGLLGGLLAIFIVLTIRFGRMIRDESRLRAQYIKEHDERTALINAKSGGTVMYICAVLLVLAGTVAGYFSEPVFFSLVGSGLFLLLTKHGCVFYLNHKL